MPKTLCSIPSALRSRARRVAAGLQPCALALRCAERGQAMILVAIVLPVIALATVGVIEWGQTYAEATQTQRAAQAAAEAVAQQLAPGDMTQSAPPGWASTLAATMVRDMLPQASGVTVAWGPGGQQLPANPSAPAPTTAITVPTFGQGSSTQTWAYAGTMSYQLPGYGYGTQQNTLQTSFGYTYEATNPQWAQQWVSGSHGYWDTSVNSGGGGSISGSGTVYFNDGWIYCSQGVSVWGGDPFVTWASTTWNWRSTDAYGSFAWVPWNFQQWYSASATSDPWTTVDSWLQQVGLVPSTTAFSDAGGPVTLGPYATVTGTTVAQRTVRPQNGYVTRFVTVTVQAPVQTLTPLFDLILPREVTRVGTAEAAGQ